jgi:hypothetical protein
MYYGCLEHVGYIEAGKWAWSYSLPVNADIPEIWGDKPQNLA